MQAVNRVNRNEEENAFSRSNAILCECISSVPVATRACRTGIRDESMVQLNVDEGHKE